MLRDHQTLNYLLDVHFFIETLYNLCACKHVGMYRYIKIRVMGNESNGGGIVAVNLNGEIG